MFAGHGGPLDAKGYAQSYSMLAWLRPSQTQSQKPKAAGERVCASGRVHVVVPCVCPCVHPWLGKLRQEVSNYFPADQLDVVIDCGQATYFRDLAQQY